MIEQRRRAALRAAAANAPSRHPAAVGKRLVERILCRGRAELLAIAGAEALDAVFVEQRFGRRHQGEGFGLVGRALVGGIEAAQAVDLVAEEIEPQRAVLARREEVDQRAAHRIFAVLGDRVGALVAERVQLRDQLSRARSARLRRCAGSAGGCGTASAAAASPRLPSSTSSCGLSRLAWSAFSVASRSAMTRRAGDARS